MESIILGGGGGGGGDDPAQGLNTGLRQRRTDSFSQNLKNVEAARYGKATQQAALWDGRNSRMHAYGVAVRNNPVKRALLVRDQNVTVESLGTLSRYNFRMYGQPPAFEGHSASLLNGLVCSTLDALDNGVGALLLRTLVLYASVALLFSMFFITFPALGDYVGALGVSQAVGVIELIIGIVFHQLILSALWSFSEAPRSLNDTFTTIVAIVDQLAFSHVNNAGPSGDDGDGKGAALDTPIALLVRMGVHMVGVYSSFSSGDVYQQAYFAHLSGEFKRTVARSAHIAPQTAAMAARAVDQLAAREVRDSKLYRFFHAASVILVHFDVVLGIYLFFIVPIQIWYAVGLMIMVVYPVMMHFLYTLREEENLMGGAFAWNSGIGQRTRYTEWTGAFVYAVRTAVSRYGVNVDMEGAYARGEGTASFQMPAHSAMLM